MASVPERMTELYDYPGKANAEIVSAVARYSRYRQFTVETRVR